jgi:phosphatidylglycerophosphate synthase
MVSKKEQFLRKVALFIHKKTGLSPNILSLMRIFLSPWIALLVIESLRKESVPLALFSIGLYFVIVVTDIFDGPLARAINDKKEHAHDVGYGGMLDRVSDKMLIVFSLVPFGVGPVTAAIIIGESFLGYQALHAKTVKEKQATSVGKIKMALQTFLMPLLLLDIFVVGDMFRLFVFAYAVLTVFFTFSSVWSHYRTEV